MKNVKFVLVEENHEHLDKFMDSWVAYMREIGDDRSDDKIIGHAHKILEIQKQKHEENKVYNIEFCVPDENIIGFCFFCISEIKYQKDTEYGLLIKPLVNYNDYGYIMEYYIDPKYRLQGYGKIMCNHVCQSIGDNNVKKIVLTPSLVSNNFWKRMGFYDSGKVDPTNDLPIFLMDI